MCAKRFGPLPKPNRCSGRSGWPDPKGLSDDDLLALIDSVTRAFLKYLEPLDADILSRADLQGHPIARIMRDTGLAETEVARRLRAARQALCRFVIRTLTPVAPAQLAGG